MPAPERTIGKLVLSVGGRVLRELLIDRKRVTIGRRPYNDLLLDDLTVSGEHAMVHTGPGGEAVVHDLRSRNGTLVNGTPVMQHVLTDGDVIDVGIYRIAYRLERLAYIAGSLAAASPSPRAQLGPAAGLASSPNPASLFEGPDTPLPPLPGFARPDPLAPTERTDLAGAGLSAGAEPGLGSGPMLTDGPLTGSGQSGGGPVTETGDKSLTGPTLPGEPPLSPPIHPHRPGPADRGPTGRVSSQSPIGHPPLGHSPASAGSGGHSLTGRPVHPLRRKTDFPPIGGPAQGGPGRGGQNPGGQNQGSQNPGGQNQGGRPGQAGFGKADGQPELGAGPAAGASWRSAGFGPGQEGGVRRFEPPRVVQPTPVDPLGSNRAVIRYLGGHDAGREQAIERPITSIRNGSGQVAVIARRHGGYYLTHVEGLAYPLVNGESIGLGAHVLRDNDLIELAGTILQFCLESGAP